jgi:hypothetical protein
VTVTAMLSSTTGFAGMCSRIAFSRRILNRKIGEFGKRGMELSPIFPAFLLNPAWPPLVTAPPRYGDGIGNREGCEGTRSLKCFPVLDLTGPTFASARLSS